MHVLRNAYYVLAKATRSKHDGGARHRDFNKKNGPANILRIYEANDLWQA